MIGNLKVRDLGLPETADLHIFGIVLSNGNAGVDELRNEHHALSDFSSSREASRASSAVRRAALGHHLNFQGFCLGKAWTGFFCLPIEHTNLFGLRVSPGTKLVRLRYRGAALRGPGREPHPPKAVYRTGILIDIILYSSGFSRISLYQAFRNYLPYIEIHIVPLLI
jgi:hypothetical protein